LICPAIGSIFDITYNIWGDSDEECEYSSLASICFLENVTISKPYQNPTSPYEKQGLGIQYDSKPTY